jgi:hypothetical protein
VIPFRRTNNKEVSCINITIYSKIADVVCHGSIQHKGHPLYTPCNTPFYIPLSKTSLQAGGLILRWAKIHLIRWIELKASQLYRIHSPLLITKGLIPFLEFIFMSLLAIGFQKFTNLPSSFQILSKWCIC